MRKPTRPLTLAASALLLAGLVSGCGSPDPGADPAGPNPSPPADSSGPITFTDDTGVEMTLEEPAARIACLTMICVDALTEVGITPVAYRDPLALDDRYAGGTTEMREITGGFGEENVEDVALSTPDLVIGLAGAQDGLRAAVERVAPLYLVDPTSWRDSVTFLRTIGDLTGTREAADTQADAFTERVEAASTERSDQVTLSMYGEPGSLGLDSIETPTGSVLAEISDYPWPAGADPFASIAVEQIADVDPDVIFAQAFSASDDSEPLSQRLSTDPLWSELAAAKQDRVVEVEAAVWATGRGTISLGLVLDKAEEELATLGD